MSDNPNPNDPNQAGQVPPTQPATPAQSSQQPVPPPPPPAAPSAQGAEGVMGGQQPVSPPTSGQPPVGSTSRSGAATNDASASGSCNASDKSECSDRVDSRDHLLDSLPNHYGSDRLSLGVEGRQRDQREQRVVNRFGNGDCSQNLVMDKHSPVDLGRNFRHCDDRCRSRQS